ncbi:hypothetical protein B0H10DRAFT_1979461, partial [Mycena sp. CBHHK59/15]
APDVGVVRESYFVPPGLRPRTRPLSPSAGVPFPSSLTLAAVTCPTAERHSPRHNDVACARERLCGLAAVR